MSLRWFWLVYDGITGHHAWARARGSDIFECMRCRRVGWRWGEL